MRKAAARTRTRTRTRTAAFSRTAATPGVCPADELRDKGRLGPGDVAFVHRASIGSGSKIQRNVKAAAGGYGTPDANVHSLAGVDWLNRMLGPEHYTPGKSVLVNSNNPADHWRSLSLLSEWSLDGIVISNDEPGYVLSSGTGERNDQLFNIAVQGPTQVNNGYADDAGRGVNGSVVAQLIKGPLYDRYPEQMFDRKVQPMSTLYVGLVCRYVPFDFTDNEDAEGVRKFARAMGFEDTVLKSAKLEEEVAQLENAVKEMADDQEQGREIQKIASKKEEIERIRTGIESIIGKGLTSIAGSTWTGKGFPLHHMHIFGYVLFTDRQAWHLLNQGNSNQSDSDGRRGLKRRMHAGSTDADQSYLPRDPNSDGFEGIKESELQGMVGAWKVGRVLDIASKRNERSPNGMSGTAYGLTANVNIEFLDWRALRRTLACGRIGEFHTAPWEWDTETGSFPADEGRLLQWPTKYTVHEYQKTDDERLEDTDIPINPYPKSNDAREQRVPINPYTPDGIEAIKRQRTKYVHQTTYDNSATVGYGGHNLEDSAGLAYSYSLSQLQYGRKLTRTALQAKRQELFATGKYPQVEARAHGSSAMDTTPVVPMLPAATAKKPPKAPTPAPVAAVQPTATAVAALVAAPEVAPKKAKLASAPKSTTPVGAPATAAETPVARTAGTVAAPVAAPEQNEQTQVAPLKVSPAAASNVPDIDAASSEAPEASGSMLGMLVGDALGGMFGSGATPSPAASKKRSVPRRAARDR